MADDRALELAELLAEVRRIDVLSKRLVTDMLAGSYSSVFRGAGLEFDRVREYVEGDDPRTVDERELTVLFLLDLSGSMTGGFGHWSVRQVAARVCACLALAAVRNSDKVGLVGFSDTVDKYVRPEKGAGHALRVVRDCLALPGTSVRTDLAPALEFAARVVPRHAVVFLVSDFLTDGWEKALGQCARRHDVVAVRLLAPELAAPPEAGLLRLRDPETGRAAVVDWSDARVRRAYAERVAAWRRGTEETLRRAQVDRMDVPIGRERDMDMIARPIQKFFRMRELRGAKR